MVVSHDRYLLERLCDTHVGLVGDGRVRGLPRGVEEYLERRSALLAAGGGNPPPVSAGASGAGAGAGPAVPVADAAAARAARKDMARLERRLARLDEQEARLHAELAENATDPEQVLALDARLRAVVAEKDQVEADWLEVAETADGG